MVTLYWLYALIVLSKLKKDIIFSNVLIFTILEFVLAESMDWLYILLSNRVICGYWIVEDPGHPMCPFYCSKCLSLLYSLAMFLSNCSKG